MSCLTIYQNRSPGFSLFSTHDYEVIVRLLAEIGVTFQQWSVDPVFFVDCDAEQILQYWLPQLKPLMDEEGYCHADVVRVLPDQPNRLALREKFINEHTHKESEVRFFVRGGGIFFLHIEDFVYRVECAQGDLISVPANTPHWFDMGTEPDFTAIRLFSDPQGWVAHSTGNELSRFYI